MLLVGPVKPMTRPHEWNVIWAAYGCDLFDTQPLPLVSWCASGGVLDPLRAAASRMTKWRVVASIVK